MTMINLPRCSGKTTLLKLKVHELYNKYDYIAVRSFDTHTTANLERYIAEYISLRTIPKGICGKRILFLIDEPFILSPAKEEEFFSLIDMFEMNGNIVDVLGIGTTAETVCVKRHFTDYL